MELRVTPDFLIRHALVHQGRHTSRLGNLQIQAATGKKLLRPSDAPLDLADLRSSSAAKNRLESYLSNLRQARTDLEAGGTALRAGADLLVQARNLALEGSNSTLDASARAALAQEVDALLERLLDQANTREGDDYLFAGSALRTPPFQVERDAAGRPVRVEYRGSEGRVEVPLSPSMALATLYSGRDIFQYPQRGATSFVGATGAAPGTGTDNAVGEATLRLRHLATTFAPDSGVQAGTGSPGGDTILGPVGTHNLTLVDTSGTGAFGTVSLNGGPVVSFTSTDTNLIVTGPEGEIVHLDTTAITPGFSGAVALAASGDMTVDDGQTWVPLDFGANQVVPQGTGGTVVNVATAGVRRAGTERLTFPGTLDAFGVLMALRDDLRNTQGLDETTLLQKISARVQDIDRVRGRVLEVVGEQSATLRNLEDLETHYQDRQLNATQRISDLEDVDMAELVVQIQAGENLMQLSYAAISRLLDLDILNFLR